MDLKNTQISENIDDNAIRQIWRIAAPEQSGRQKLLTLMKTATTKQPTFERDLSKAFQCLYLKSDHSELQNYLCMGLGTLLTPNNMKPIGAAHLAFSAVVQEQNYTLIEILWALAWTPWFSVRC